MKSIDIVKTYINKLNIIFSKEQVEVLEKFYNRYLAINSGAKKVDSFNNRKYKYPYKPYLIIILTKLMTGNSINIDDTFLSEYKNYLCKDPFMVEKYNGIDEWSLKTIRTWLYKNPMSFQRTPFLFTFDTANNKIILNEKFSPSYELKVLLLNLSNTRLLACTGIEVESNNFENITNILNYEKTEYILTNLRNSKFRELIIQKMSSCQFCNINVPLQAAHIVPFSKYHNDDEYNGLVLCANCHFIFDKYLRLQKENGVYCFYMRKNIDPKIKDSIINKLELYSKAVNAIIAKEPKYQPYFDKLIEIQNKY